MISVPNKSNKAIDITIAITCFNEALFIIATIEDIVRALDEVGVSCEVIVIDDHSTDNSVAVIRDYINQHPDLPIILKVNDKNRGLAYNYLEAAFLGVGKYYRWVGGDNSEPKDSLVRLFKHIGVADIVIPFHINKSRTRFRRKLSLLFTIIVNLVSGYNIKYYNGSSIYLRYNVMRWHSHSYGFGFQADMINRMLDEGFSYAQISYPTVERKSNDSTALTMRNVLSVLHTLLEISMRRVRRMLYGRSAPMPVEIIIDNAS